MADRIDAEGRIKYGEGTADAGEQETPQAANPTVMEKADHKAVKAQRRPSDQRTAVIEDA